MSDDGLAGGVSLRHTARGHDKGIRRLAWSPNGELLASASDDGTTRVWTDGKGESLCILEQRGAVFNLAFSPLDGTRLATAGSDGTVHVWRRDDWSLEHKKITHAAPIWGIAFSPDGKLIATGSDDRNVCLWDATSGDLIRYLDGHSDQVWAVAFSHDGKRLASSCADGTLRLWSVADGTLENQLKGHSGAILTVKFSPDDSLLASASQDTSIRIWNIGTAQFQFILEGHTREVEAVDFSWDGRLLASKSVDGTIRIWRCSTWETVSVLQEPVTGWWHPALAFHPHKPLLASLGEDDNAIRIWHINDEELLEGSALDHTADEPVRYRSARVVLLGDSGVGKSGLAMALAARQFRPTESTHGRNIMKLERSIDITDGSREIHEMFLWDTAGQASFSLVPLFHLQEVSTAVIVVDASPDWDPTERVRDWLRILRQAQQSGQDTAVRQTRFLVVGRADRGTLMDHTDIQRLAGELGLDGGFVTSALTGWGIDDLRDAVLQSVDWQGLPGVSSNRLFRLVKEFLLEYRESDRVLATLPELSDAFHKHDNSLEQREDLEDTFAVCIRLLGDQRLIRLLSFGGLVLLRAELLDDYAAAILNEARSDPDGLGSISEEAVLSGDLNFSCVDTMGDSAQQRLLLIATVQELLRNEMALKEMNEETNAVDLIFPTLVARDYPEAPDLPNISIVFAFEGPVRNIYATLVVRLSHSHIFDKQQLWRSASTFSASAGGTCGIYLRYMDDTRGELTLFFDSDAVELTRYQFEEYVESHLQRRAIPDTVWRRRVYSCAKCLELITDSQARRRLERGHSSIRCNVCDTEVSLLDREERLTAPKHVVSVPQMDRWADNQRDREMALMTLKGKVETGDFDVFLCHNSEDKPAIKEIAYQLQNHGIRPWLDEWCLRPGFPWQRTLEKKIKDIESAAVFVGSSGVGPWQNTELEAFLRQFANRKEPCPVIPVILPDCRDLPPLPLFLTAFTWVDFRREDPDPLAQLIWGITGNRGWIVDADRERRADR